MISGAAVRPVAARRTPRAAVSAAQIRAIMDAPGRTPAWRQAAIDAALAGATVDVGSLATRPRMPGIEIGAGLRANADQPRRHTSGHAVMPGIKIGGQAPRVHTGRMPGISLQLG